MFTFFQSSGLNDAKYPYFLIYKYSYFLFAQVGAYLHRYVHVSVKISKILTKTKNIIIQSAELL